MNNLTKANMVVIQQLTDLLTIMPSNIYRQPLKSLHQHSVGQHTRHIIEFYGCLWAGLKSGTINYDLRERNVKIEVDKLFAISRLNDIMGQMDEEDTDQFITIQTHACNEPIQSSSQRELAYLIEHTTHHLAIIKIGLNEAYPAFVLPHNFGVATSTMAHRNQTIAAV